MVVFYLHVYVRPVIVFQAVFFLDLLVCIYF